MRYLAVIALLIMVAAGTASCGKKGPPQPPDRTEYYGK